MNTSGELEVLEKENTDRKTGVNRWSMYRTSCNCKHKDHQLTIDLEEEDGIRTLRFWIDTRLDQYDDSPYWFAFKYDGMDFIPKLKDYLCESYRYYYRSFKRRIKYAFKILLSGRIETESEFFIRGDAQLLAIADVIIDFIREGKE